MTEIKFAGKKDIVPIYETETLSFSQPLSKNEIENILNNKSYTVMIIQKQKRYVGHIIFYTVGDTAEIISVAIREEERNKGHGKKLVIEAVTRNIEAGVKNILLEVRVSNSAAINLYKACGFKIIAERTDFYEKPRENAYTMKYDIRKVML